MKIVQGKSAEGVSLLATLQELLTYSVSLSRSYRRELPFRYTHTHAHTHMRTHPALLQYRPG